MISTLTAATTARVSAGPSMNHSTNVTIASRRARLRSEPDFGAARAGRSSGMNIYVWRRAAPYVGAGQAVGPV